MRSAEDTADARSRPASSLLAATEEFTGRCLTLLALHPVLAGRYAAPLAAAHEAVRQLATRTGAKNVSPVRQLQQFDDVCFSRVSQFADVLSGMRDRAAGERGRAEANVRALTFLSFYEDAWRAAADAQAMAGRFAAIPEPVLAELRALRAPEERVASEAVWQARRLLVKEVKGFLSELRDQQRLLGAQRLALWREGIHLGPQRVAPPDGVELDWHVPPLSDALRLGEGEPADRGLPGWHAWVDAFAAALAEWFSRTSGRVLAPYLTARDELLAAWLHGLAAVRSRADDELRSANALVAEVDEASATLSRLVAARDACHRPDGAGLTPAVRAALAAVHEAARDVTRDRQLLKRLAELSAADEIDVCIPVVATMKAGKSTTLGVLLGLEVAPRRSHAMTTLATKYWLTSAVTEPEFSAGDGITHGYGKLLDRVLRRLPGNAARLTDHPHLARLAARLDTADLPPESCRGTSAVLDALASINDFARLAMLVLPAAEARAMIDWVPEVRVPDGRLSDEPRGPRLRVMLVDTPGLGEAAGRNLMPAIVTRALAQADGCVWVTNYLDLDSVATADLAAQVKKRFGGRTSPAVWVTVNKIDKRKEAGDLGKADVTAKVLRLLGLADRPVPVVETWAELALAVVGCEGSSDPAPLAALVRLIDPFGSDETPQPDEAEQLIRKAAAKSGLGALRTTVTGGIAQRGSALAIESALDRLNSAGALDTRALDSPVGDLRWALSEARSIPLAVTGGPGWGQN